MKIGCALPFGLFCSLSCAVRCLFVGRLFYHGASARRPLADRWTEDHVCLVQESLPHLQAARPFEIISLTELFV